MTFLYLDDHHGKFFHDIDTYQKAQSIQVQINCALLTPTKGRFNSLQITNLNFLKDVPVIDFMGLT